METNDLNDKVELEEPDHVDWDMLSSDHEIAIQWRKPTLMPEPAHFHPSIEINYLMGCDMTYSFSGDKIEVPRGRFSLFWAAHPHSKIAVRDIGVMTNVYVSLSRFLQWSLPVDFVNALLVGNVLVAEQNAEGDETFARRLAKEAHKTDVKWQRQHALEVQSRISRMALEGWKTLRDPSARSSKTSINGNAIVHFEKMLRFVAMHFSSRIAVADVAAAAGVSQSYAILLFSKLLGRTILEHIRDIRLIHAKMLLVETDRKILTVAMDCGFGSLSSFYDCFQNHVGIAPAAFRRHSSQVEV